jgi:NADPH2:quinone reductase
MRADMVWKMPEAMSWIEGAAFPVVYLTSYYALNNRAKLKAGETLLVLGAAGGVGLTACEIGAAMGADVIAVASTAEKRALAAKHGARRQIDYGPARLRDSVNELTAGKGADVIYDPVGGDAFGECLRCIAWGGRLLVVGFASGRIASAPANLLLLKGAELRGIRTAGWREQFPHEADVAMQGVLALYGAGKLKPYVSTVLPLEKAPDALKILDGRQATGKVVLDVDA